MSKNAMILFMKTLIFLSKWLEKIKKMMYSMLYYEKIGGIK